MRYRLTTTVPLLFFFSVPLLLRAQPADDQTLFFSPELTVEIKDLVRQMEEQETSLAASDSMKEIRLGERTEWHYIRLLPMIFFESGTAAVPSRYRLLHSRREARRYDEVLPEPGRIEPEEIEKHYDILNILGYRMSRLPETRIELEGSWSFEPGEDSLLALERAETVRDYLRAVWGIDTSRLRLLPSRRRSLPQDHLLRQEEARSLLINASSWELVRPLHYLTSVRSTGYYRIGAAVVPNADPQKIAAVEILLKAGDVLVGRAEIPGSPDSTRYRIYGVWDHDFSHIHEGTGTLEIEAVVWLRDGTTRRSNLHRIPIRIEPDTVQGRSKLVNIWGSQLVLPFYLPGNESVGGLQRLMLREFCTELFRNTPPDHRYTVRLQGEADVSDLPSLPEEEIQVRTAMLGKAVRGRAAFMTEYQPVLRPIRLYTADTLDEQDILHSYLTASYRNGWITLFNLNQTIDTAGEIRITETDVRRLDSIAWNRERELAFLLYPILKGKLRDTITPARGHDRKDDYDMLIRDVEDSADRAEFIEEMEAHRRASRTTQSWDYLPEQRFYNRRVIVDIEWDSAPWPQILKDEQERRIERLIRQSGYEGEEWEDRDAFEIFLWNRANGYDTGKTEADNINNPEKNHLRR